MDRRDEFTKWMGTVEKALKAEGTPLAENVPAEVNMCGCGSWNCPTCFPSQDDAAVTADIASISMNPAEMCPHCGQPTAAEHMHTPDDEFGLEEVSDIQGVDDIMDAPMEEEPQDIEPVSLPRSSDGRGVKLGDIVQHTEFRQSGEESPLTHGSDLEEAGFDDDDDNDFSDLSRYEPRQHNMSDYDADPLGARDHYNWQAGEPKSEADAEDAMDMISDIKYMQSMGLSKGPRDYSEEELATIGFPELKKIHAEVTGNIAAEGMVTMENVDKDVAAMLATLKKYDKLVESCAPVLGAKRLSGNEVMEDDEGKNPWEKKADDKESDPKVTQTHKGGTVTKTDTGLKHKGTYGGEKKEVKESSEVDPEVLEWMARLAKVAR